MNYSGTLLTHRQAEIISLRASGLSTKQIADRIGTGEKNVIIIESRINRKIEEAVNTIRYLQSLKDSLTVKIHAGTDLLDAVREIMNFCDGKGIKIRGNIIDVLSSLRSGSFGRIANGKILDPLNVIILHTGRWFVLNGA